MSEATRHDRPHHPARPRSPRPPRGFTLIEILIVVVILGILAAIAVPQFSNASTDARRSALQSTVQSVRSQINLYKLQHGNALPNLAADWSQFTGVTAFAGRSYGPYMQSAPRNPLRDGSTAVKNGTNVLASETQGFVYDYGTNGDGTGRFWGVEPDAGGTLTLVGD